ncbi:hypothetical protein FE257_003851 [Aspergillus nanangensis]|uniref:Uncharacterized protein n=1 Tax=Aspergillus nanangensis TaxID=2582783 RepID=A0AAD4CB49_ASPNN|nr:hypothetical protein FE257_003851 [Aspergillus nanangensis]
MSEISPAAIPEETQASNLLSKAPDQMNGVKQALEGRENWEDWSLYITTALKPVYL